MLFASSSANWRRDIGTKEDEGGVASTSNVELCVLMGQGLSGGGVYPHAKQARPGASTRGASGALLSTLSLARRFAPARSPQALHNRALPNPNTSRAYSMTFGTLKWWCST